MKPHHFAIAAIALAATAVPALSQDLEKAINARKSQMTLLAWNIGPLGAMAKGTIPYNAEVATAAARNLAAVASLNTASMWVPGTDSTAMPDKTAAKVEAWTTWPAIGESNDALKAAATELASVAGNGLDAMRAGLGPVGKACGDCHKTYRVKK